MNDEVNFLQLLHRYLADELSAAEEDRFFELLEDPALRLQLERVIDGKLMNFKSGETISDKRLQEIERSILTPRSSFRPLWIRGVAAAAVLVFITFFIGIYIKKDESTVPDIVDVASYNQSKFTDFSSTQMIDVAVSSDRDLSEKSVVITAVQDSLLHFSKPNNTTGQQYTTVYVPSGRRQEIILPDQSKAWLNAGSYLTFPTVMDGRQREVYLNGEGYFDIKNNGSRFTVRTKTSSIAVLGTSFNVNSYEDGSTVSVELLTGKVRLSSNYGTFSSIEMHPGEKVVYHRSTNQIRIDRNASGEDILWTKKQIALTSTKLYELFATLERFYNVRIHADQQLKTKKISYSGRLSLKPDVLTTLQSIYELKDYDLQINDKEVYIKEKTNTIDN